MKTDVFNSFTLRVILIITQILTLSCSSHYQKEITIAESMINTSPYKADSILNSINTIDIDNKTLGKWCILKYRLKDSINATAPDLKELEIAYDYYNKTINNKKIVELGILLSRSYIEKSKYSNAMDVLLPILDISLKNKDFNSAGYINTYIGDIYEFSNDAEKAKFHFSNSQDLFYQSQNHRSYILAFKNIARQLAYQDSLELAMKVINKGESLADTFHNNLVSKSIYNAKGNIYRMMGEYDLAEKYLLKAISIDSTGLVTPTYLALSNMYMKINDIEKAYHYLNKAEANKDSYEEIILYNKYLYEKKKSNYNTALNLLEQYIDKYDEKIKIQEDHNIHELEKKYNNILVKAENQKLKISQLTLIMFACLFLLIALFLFIIYQKYKTKSKLKIKNLEENISTIQEELKNKIEEINITKAKLGEKCFNDDTLRKSEDEREKLIIELKRLKKYQLSNSSIGLKLTELSKTHIPNNQDALIDNKLFSSMETEINKVFPKFKSEILCMYPKIADSEWNYCCLLLFGFDIKSESILLCITPQSVRTRRSRLRKNLNVDLDDTTLYEYFIDILIF